MILQLQASGSAKFQTYTYTLAFLISLPALSLMVRVAEY